MLRIVGLYKGAVELPATASVLELKQAVAAASGLAIGNIKLLAGGKHLNEDGRTLQSYGVSSQKTIMVLRQEAAPEARAEDEAMRRVAAAVAATAAGAAAAVARAADYGSDDEDTSSGGSSSSSGPSGTGGYGSYGSNYALAGTSGGGEGGGGGRSGSRRGGAASRRPRLELTNQDGELMDIAEGDSALLMQGMLLHDKGKACMRSAALAVAKAKAARRAVAASAPAPAAAAAAAPATATASGAAASASADVGSGVEDAGKGAAVIDASNNTAAAAAAAATAAASTSPASASAVGPLDPAELDDAVRLARAEALGYFLAAEEAYGRVDAKYLDSIDNYAYLCLDAAWLLFLTRDTKRLALAARLLKEAEAGFRRSHGAGLERLTALKGKHCAERALYVRLHLLQGVVRFLEGQSGEASALLIRAGTECKALAVPPQMVARLRRESATVWGVPIDAKVATRAALAGRGTLDGARQFLEAWRQRQHRVDGEEERRRRQRRQRRWGKTADGRGYIDDALVSALVEAGHSHAASVAALRQANNDAAAAVVALTAPAAASNAGEAMAHLLSMGVPQEAAGQALAQGGSLEAALAQLGLESSSASDDSGRSGSDSSGGSGTLSGDGSGSTSSGGSGGGGGGGAATAAETPEERQRRREEEQFFHELAMGVSQDDEAHLDASLADEAAAIEMYMRLCEGKIPAQFDLAKIAAAATRGSGSGNGGGGGGNGMDI